MVTRSPALDTLRDLVGRTGSLFLRNARWVPGVTCSTCAGIPNPGFPTCYRCAERVGSVGLADHLGFVTYAWPRAQSGQTMHAYKRGGATSYQLVASLLTYAVVAHWNCIADRGGTHPDAWAYVPSLSGRQGLHPLARIASQFMGRVPHVPVHVSETVGDKRSFNPAHFVLSPSGAGSRHVLLLEDTWVGGGRLQSASAVLKAAGVDQVTGLSVARWLDPGREPTKLFIEGLKENFDPDVCPYTGAHC